MENKILNMLVEKGETLKLMWIPAHTEIEGNEANDALNEGILPGTKATEMDWKRWLKNAAMLKPKIINKTKIDLYPTLKMQKEPNLKYQFKKIQSKFVAKCKRAKKTEFDAESQNMTVGLGFHF
jgi:hypothetical protein